MGEGVRFQMKPDEWSWHLQYLKKHMKDVLNMHKGLQSLGITVDDFDPIQFANSLGLAMVALDFVSIHAADCIELIAMEGRCE